MRDLRAPTQQTVISVKSTRLHKTKSPNVLDNVIRWPVMVVLLNTGDTAESVRTTTGPHHFTNRMHNHTSRSL